MPPQACDQKHKELRRGRGTIHLFTPAEQPAPATTAGKPTHHEDQNLQVGVLDQGQCDLGPEQAMKGLLQALLGVVMGIVVIWAGLAMIFTSQRVSYR